MKENMCHSPPILLGGDKFYFQIYGVGWGSENIAGLWFASAGISTQAATMDRYEREYEIIRKRLIFDVYTSSKF